MNFNLILTSADTPLVDVKFFGLIEEDKRL